MSSAAHNVARNTIVQFAGKIIGSVLAVFTLAIILRYLGQEGFGKYTTITTYVSIFSIMADLGLYLIITREISKPHANEEKLLSNAFTIKLIASIIILFIASLTSLLLYSGSIIPGVIIVSFSFLFVLLNQVLIGLFQKHFDMSKVAIGEVASRIVWLIGAFIVARFDLGLLWLLSTIVLSNFANFLIVFIFSRKYVKIKLAFDKELWLKIIKMTAPLALSVIFNLIYFKIATIFLSVMKEESDVGIYGAPFKVLESLIAFAAIFAGLLLPLLSRFYKENRVKFLSIFKKGVDVLIIFVIPMCLGTIFFAQEIMTLAGGEEFTGSAEILKILILAVAAIFFSHIFGNTAIACHQQKKIMWIYMTVALLSIILNLVLIPKYSYYGASIAVTVSEISVALAIFILIYVKAKVSINYKTILKSAISALGMLIVLFILPDWYFVISVLIASVTYFGILYLLKGFSKQIVYEIINIKKKT
jgi:O-antigen/teichoic acid export membrane protein